MSLRGASKESTHEVSSQELGSWSPRGLAQAGTIAPMLLAGQLQAVTPPLGTRCLLSVPWAWQSTGIRTGSTESRREGHPLLPLPQLSVPFGTPRDRELARSPESTGLHSQLFLKAPSDPGARTCWQRTVRLFGAL